ncbi:hypothetical protein JW960_16435 [candidate division KSB1 bacterium]|nr:hypothetical protein [candidate division KSB1 bacterium]
MSTNNKQLCNPFSTGGGGAHFEAHVQASFVTLMLTGGYAPCLPWWPIREIKLQGRISGYNTDDLIVFVEQYTTKERCKLLGQVKHSIRFTQKDSELSNVIKAAWSDFNNPDLFTKGKDIIALITGPLSETDFHNVQWLLNQARHTKNSDDFFKNVKQASFSPPKSVEKLGVIQHHLKIANQNVDILKDEIYLFLKHFHLLGYDLGKEIGVVLSLLHSHISQFNRQRPEWIWGRIVDLVQTWNQNAGTIIADNIPEDILQAFKQPAIRHIPKETSLIKPEKMDSDWSKHPYATDFALMNLVGSWDENYESDLLILCKLLNQNCTIWLSKIREAIQLPSSPFSLQNGLWQIIDRVELWNLLGSRIFDQNLDIFKEIVLTVLTERDPSFELPPQDRYMASIHGKVLIHSSALRKGMAEGLALLGNKPDALIHCSIGKVETTVVLTIREIFTDIDWVSWGSLDNLLPILAEAAPDEFLNAVEKALNTTPCPFYELFLQEAKGMMGNNYLTGLLWALEGLAWDEKYLVRVCTILGELANNDPGGQWINRPINSLSTIFMPWLPQTLAPIEKRKVAVNTLHKEFPAITWKLIIRLLPNQHQISMGSHKPSWRINIPEDYGKDFNQSQYLEQLSFYGEIAVSMAEQDINYLCELIDHLNFLPKTYFDQFLELLSSSKIVELPENSRLKIWEKLTEFTTKHRRFQDAKWALNDNLLSSIESISDLLTPSNPINLYHQLFSDRDFELFDKNGSWDEQRKRLSERRKKAIREILNLKGLETVIQFSETVEFPSQVGIALGSIADEKTDKFLLPKFLEIENKKLSSFMNGYIYSRHNNKSWQWVDNLNKENWKIEQISVFLSYLPFTNEAWIRVENWLINSQGNYWQIVNVNPYQTQKDLSFAIEKLIEFGRPRAAIDCLVKLRYDKQPISIVQCIQALLSAISSTEPVYSMDIHQTVELIEMIQNSSDVSLDDLFRIEWAYLSLLDRHYGIAPKTLENRLASDPEFFCEIIRLIYRSNKSDITIANPSEELKAIATNAWQLLNEWRIPPGMQNGDGFDDAHFLNWIKQVKNICSDSGHLEVALNKVGEVLIHCPADKDGLWINMTVANELNLKDAEYLRDGYSIGIYNSRGVHWVDPTGKEEREFAVEYHQKAEQVENVGYQRFAVTLRSIADHYNREAERNIVKRRNVVMDL